MRAMLLSGLTFIGLLAGCTRTEPPPEPVRAVRVLTASAQEVGGLREYAGEIRARTETRLSFRVGGKLTRRLVDAGAPVKAGQPIAELDPQDLRLSQDAARAAVVAAQVNLEQTAADFKRYRELRDQGFISSAELERRETSLKSAQASLDQARAQANVQGNQARYTTLVAEAPGVVTAVDAEPGMVVSSGTSVVRVALDGPRDVVFSVPEDQLVAFRAAAQRPGALTVRLWGQDGSAYPASVREVAATADAATRTFQVKADVGRAPVRLGQTATVQLELPRTDGAIKLPLSALMERGGATVVWKLDPTAMTVQPQPVSVRTAEGNQAVLAGGVAAGELIVTAGVHTLTPGQKVTRYVEPGTASAPAGATTPAPAPTAAASAASR